MITNRQQLIEALEQPIAGVSDEQRELILAQLNEQTRRMDSIPAPSHKLDFSPSRCARCAYSPN